MAAIDVKATIDETHELLEEKDRILAAIAENRTLLRGAVRNKKTTAEQTKWITDTFPEQEKKTPEQRVKDAEKRLKEVQDKADKAKDKG